MANGAERGFGRHMSIGKQLVQEALNDSYYPDLGQSVNAERMINVINSDPLIAAASEMLELLKRISVWKDEESYFQCCDEAIDLIARASGETEGVKND